MKFFFLFLAFLAVSCGNDQTPTVEYAPPPAASDPAYDAIASIIKADCGGCHYPGSGKPALGTAAAFKASNAKAELQAGSMPPPPKTISDQDKAKLLAYLGG